MNKTKKRNDEIWYYVLGGVFLLFISYQIPDEYFFLIPLDMDSHFNRILIMGGVVALFYGIWSLRKKILKGILSLLKGVVNPIRFFYYRQKAGQDIRYLKLYPCTDIRMEPDKVMRFSRDFANMARLGQAQFKKGNPYFRLHFAWPVDTPDKDQPIRIYLGYPQDKQEDRKSVV